MPKEETKQPKKRPRRQLADRSDQDVNHGGEPAQERGERIETGKAIYRGGKSEGTVPGATPSEEK